MCVFVGTITWRSAWRPSMPTTVLILSAGMTSVIGRERAIVVFSLLWASFGTDTVCESRSTLGSVVVTVPARATAAPARATPATLHHIHWRRRTRTPSLRISFVIAVLATTALA